MNVKDNLVAMLEEHLMVAKNAELEGFDTLKKYLDELDSTISSYMDRMGIKNIYFDLERQSINIPSTPAQDMANRIREKYRKMVCRTK